MAYLNIPALQMFTDQEECVLSGIKDFWGVHINRSTEDINHGKCIWSVPLNVIEVHVRLFKGAIKL